MCIHEQQLQGKTGNRAKTLDGIERNVRCLCDGINQFQKGFDFQLHGFRGLLPRHILHRCALLALDNRAGFAFLRPTLDVARCEDFRACMIVVGVCKVGKQLFKTVNQFVNIRRFDFRLTTEHNGNLVDCNLFGIAVNDIVTVFAVHPKPMFFVCPGFKVVGFHLVPIFQGKRTGKCNHVARFIEIRVQCIAVLG